MKKQQLFTILLLASLIVIPATASAQAELCNILKTLIGALQTIGGSLAVIAFIFAGFMYLTSQGEPSKMDTAKKALFAGLIGILIVILAPSIDTIVKELFGKTATLCS